MVVNNKIDLANKMVKAIDNSTLGQASGVDRVLDQGGHIFSVGRQTSFSTGRLFGRL